MDKCLFIDIGETNAYFTLNMEYEAHVPAYCGDGLSGVSTVTRYRYLFNLSQNPDVALAKAKKYSEKCNKPLRDPGNLAEKLREITRLTAEQAEKRRLAIIKQREEWEAEQQARKEQREAKWKAEWEELHGHKPKPNPTLTIGAIGQRLTLNVVVIWKAQFERQRFGYSGGTEIVHVTTMYDKDSGACVVVKSPSFNPYDNEELRIKATVKGYSEYRGQAQTIVQRVTYVK